jgi:hypothetical protein
MMNDDELTQAIEEIVKSDIPYVHVIDDETSLDGTFKNYEIVEIAELLKKEGRV